MPTGTALRITVSLVLGAACCRESCAWGLRAGIRMGARPGAPMAMCSRPPSIAAARQPETATQQQEVRAQENQDAGAAPRPASQGVRDWAAGQAASLLISLAVLSIAVLSPVVKDAEAAVARMIPTRVSHFLRDRWQSWNVFNCWTWALAAPGLALARFDLLTLLLGTENQNLNLPYGEGSDRSCASSRHALLVPYTYIYTYRCMYVYMYICICIYIYICICICICICI